MENNENKTTEMTENQGVNANVPAIEPAVADKKGVGTWLKEHKKTILGGLAAVGGGILCFLLGAATQRSADSTEDDYGYDTNDPYDPDIKVYELEPETESNDEDEAV